MENKKLWMGILVMVLVFGFIMTACGGGQKLTGPTDAFYFRLVNGGEEYSIAKGKTSEGKINIPASYRPDTDSDFLPVTQIDDFSGLTSIASITIPADVTSIGTEAFAGWTSSQTINIQGKANREATDWVNEWDDGCNAVINYGK